MRVALFTELYPPSIGGQEIRFQQLARALAKRNHAVSVFTIDHVGNLNPHEQDGQISIHRNPRSSSYKQTQNARIRRSIKTILLYSLWCRRQAIAGGFDVLIYNQWPIGHVMLAPRNKKSPIIIDWCETRSGLFWKTLQTWLPKYAHKNMAVSESVGSQMTALSGRDTFCIPSGVVLEEYHNPPQASRAGLLYVGRLATHKNLPATLDVFEALCQSGYTGNLTIAGTGPDAKLIASICAASPFHDRIKFLGFVEDDAKANLIASAKFLIITSKREGFPRVVAEAMASGTPTITMDFPDNGTKDVVRQYDCGIVTSPNPQDAARAILAADSNWEALSQKTAHHASQLDWDFLVSKLEQQIEGLKK